MVQLTLLLDYTVLLIGCSLLDPNVRRILDIVVKMRPGNSHYAFFRDPYYREDSEWYQRSYAAAFRSVQQPLLEGLGVQPIWVHKYEEIASALTRLRA